MDRRIGVIDSGIGGLTVVKALQKLIPGEDIIYFGDNINLPYGNKSKEEILSLSNQLLDFMEECNVKIVAIASNTISAMVDELILRYSFPIVDIITPTVMMIPKMNTYNLSIIGTEFTINSGVYQKLLIEQNPDFSITTEGSKTLATIIDRGDFDSLELRKTINNHINNLLNKGDLINLVVACTHFQIVENYFKEAAPMIKIIDPAFQLAKEVRMYLEKNSLQKTGTKGKLEIYTSGDMEIYHKVIDKLKLKNVKLIQQYFELMKAQ